VRAFKTPKKSFGDLDAEAAATVIAAAGDVALILDRAGIIRDLAFSSEEMALAGGEAWLGKHWADTVTVESRIKVEALLRDAAAKAMPRWRHINHPVAQGADVPVLYSAVQIGREGQVVAVGRNLGAIAALQRKLVDAQQSMEQDYSRLRHAETRYRLLFQMASEAVFIVDAASQKVVEANPSALQFLGEPARRILGRSLLEIFEGESSRAVETLLASVRAAGRADDVRVRLSDGKREFLVSASLLRQESTPLFLVRMSPVAEVAGDGLVPSESDKLLKIMERVPDGFVVTDPEGRILTTNAAFLELAQLATEEQARGESLGRWLGRPGVDLNVLIANLRQHGSVRLFATTIRDEYGATTEVEISAVSVLNDDQSCFGFAIRNVGRRLSAEVRGDRELPRSVAQLTELVGRVSLKDLVRETTDVIERLCIEAALELTGDNRASAAEMLGLSRQSLYVKLRRYGLGDLAIENEE